MMSIRLNLAIAQHWSAQNRRRSSRIDFAALQHDARTTRAISRLLRRANNNNNNNISSRICGARHARERIFIRRPVRPNNGAENDVSKSRRPPRDGRRERRRADEKKSAASHVRPRAYRCTIAIVCVGLGVRIILLYCSRLKPGRRGPERAAETVEISRFSNT